MSPDRPAGPPSPDAPVPLDEAAFEQAVASPRFLLFKHSLVCPISAAAFSEYRRFVASHPDVPTGWIDVIGQRPLARGISERTGIRHESPQAMWFVGGKVTWTASHAGINATSLARVTSA